jgi:hypothetical protein
VSAPPLPPGGIDLTFLYQVVRDMDHKLDQFIERFVPRPEIDARFGALEQQLIEARGDREKLHGELEQVRERRKADLKWAAGTLLGVIGAASTVYSIVKP